MVRPVASLCDRKNKLLLGLFAALIFFFSAPPSDAQTQGLLIDKAYQEALRSFSSGDLKKAIGQYEDLLAMDPAHAGALIDLAKIYCLQGDKIKSDELLSIIEIQFDPPPQIKKVIAQARSARCTAQNPVKWLMAIGAGYDSNINQGTDTKSIFVSIGDQFSEFLLSPNYQPSSSGFLNITSIIKKTVSPDTDAFGFISAKAHQNSGDEFDTASVLGGIEKKFAFDEMQASLDAGVGIKTLGGSTYQELILGQLQVKPRASESKHAHNSLGFGLLYSRYPNREALNSLEIAGQVLRTITIPSKNLQLRGGVGWNLDHALNQRPGGDRHGPLFSLEAAINLGHNKKAVLGFQRRELKSETSYAPPFFNEKRSQKIDIANLAIEHALTRRRSIKAEFIKVRNRDSIPIYDHNRNILSIHWIVSSD